jgi:hypothetical protein
LTGLVHQNLIISNSIDDILEQVNKAEYGAHYLLIHPELKILREIYSRSIKTRLENNNEIVVILSYYETADNIRKILSGRRIEDIDTDAYADDDYNSTDDEDNNKSIDVTKYEDEDSLIIMDSLKGYFSLNKDDKDWRIGNDKNNGTDIAKRLTSFIEQLVKRAESTGKNGVCVFADLGSFYHYSNSTDANSAVDKLVEYELSLPSRYNIKLKGFCIYHRSDFDKRLTEEQKQKLLNHHGKGLIIMSD